MVILVLFSQFFLLLFHSLGIGHDLCVARGCCYKAGGNPSCFYPEAGQVNITKVHVVHGCHFDAGYVDYFTKVANSFFDKYFPAIYEVFGFRQFVLFISLGRYEKKDRRRYPYEVHLSRLFDLFVFQLSC